MSKFTEGYQLMTTQKWKDWCVYMQSNATGNVRDWKGDPGPQGYWKIEKISGDKYKIAPKEWPYCYMYMQDTADGNVRGWVSEPGKQGHWTITQNGTVMVNGESVPTFELSTARWPHWKMYMQDLVDGNVRGYDGDPGPQGYFIFKPAPK